MKQVTLTLPSDTLALPCNVEGEAKLYLVAKALFWGGKISLRQVSALAGYSKRAFVEILGKHKIPVFDYPAEELKKDLKNASGC